MSAFRVGSSAIFWPPWARSNHGVITRARNRRKIRRGVGTITVCLALFLTWVAAVGGQRVSVIDAKGRILATEFRMRMEEFAQCRRHLESVNFPGRVKKGAPVLTDRRRDDFPYRCVGREPAPFYQNIRDGDNRCRGCRVRDNYPVRFIGPPLQLTRANGVERRRPPS